EAFESCVKRPVIQHVSGLQVEQLMRPKSAIPNLAGRELITKIGEIAAWLADAEGNSVFSDFVEDSGDVNKSPKENFEKLNASQTVDALIDDALKLDVIAENTPDANQQNKISQDQEDIVAGEQQVTALRERHRELKLHAAFLFELRVSDNKRPLPERDLLEKTFGSLSPVSPQPQSKQPLSDQPFDLPLTLGDFRPY